MEGLVVRIVIYPQTMTAGPPAVRDVAIGVARPKAAISCSQNAAICL